MWIIIKGDPVTGYFHIGPFPSKEAGVRWANPVFAEETDWWPAEISAPKDFEDEMDGKEFEDERNNDPVICNTCGLTQTCDSCQKDLADSEPRVVSIEELQRMMGEQALPRAVMVDLSEIPVGI